MQPGPHKQGKNKIPGWSQGCQGYGQQQASGQSAGEFSRTGYPQGGSAYQQQPPEAQWPQGYQGYGQQQTWEQPLGMAVYNAGAHPSTGHPQGGLAYQEQPPETQQLSATALARPGSASMQAGRQPLDGQPAQRAEMAPGHALQPHIRTGNARFENLLEYLENCIDNDEFADLSVLQHFVKEGGPEECNAVSEECGGNPLHLLVEIGAATPEDAAACVRALLQGGASVNTKDDDGDTPLDVALTMAAQSDDDSDEEEKDLQPGKRNRQSRQLVRGACMKVLVQESIVEIDNDRLQRICAFAREHQPSDREDELLAAVKMRVDLNDFNKVWESQGLLTYLQDCCYEKNCGADPAIVKSHIQRGAWANFQPKKGVGALHLVALNPYHGYAEVREVTRLLMESDPKCAEVRDGFKLTALQWAEDYPDLAKQHNLKYWNLSTLLAFAELLPEGSDSGLVCIKKGSTKYTALNAESVAKLPILRFAVGDRVKALVAVPGGNPTWEEGVVVSRWLRHRFFPITHPGFPYQVQLDLGTLVLCLHDRPDLIRAENDKAPVLKPEDTTAATQKKAAKRFEKRKRPDGQWEMFDSKTGNAKIIPTPDTSDED